MAKDDHNAGSGQANEGEGNKTAARHYNEAARRTVKSGKVDEKAHEAEKALEGDEGKELAAAEEAGKQRSHGEDPELARKK